MTSLPEPTSETAGTADPAGLFAQYLSWCRETAIRKVTSVSTEEQRTSRLPSGWTPLELLSHLAHMEQRWFVWGFLGEPVVSPWGDWSGERWQVADHVTAADLVALMRTTGERTADVLATAPLDQPAATGGRFEQDPPSLAWICFHVLQEYARHLGHLDVVVELAGGPTGE